MLAVNAYPADYIERCEDDVQKWFSAVSPIAGDGAHVVYSHEILTLDRMFAHRTRALEGKDGNALNEVRMICDGLLDNAGMFPVVKAIKYSPQTSVLGLSAGDTIAVDRAGFERLAAAFFAELRSRFGA